MERRQLLLVIIAIRITTRTLSTAEQYVKDTAAKSCLLFTNFPDQNKGVPLPPWLCSLDVPGAALCEYKWKQIFFWCLFSIFQNTTQAYLERLKMLNFCTHNFLFPIRKKVLATGFPIIHSSQYSRFGACSSYKNKPACSH